MIFPQATGYVVTALTLLLAWLVLRRAPASVVPASTLSRPAFTVAAFALLVSIYPRAFHAGSMTWGFYLFEELSASVVYMHKMLNDLKTWAGATQMVFFVAMDAWRFVFGLKAEAARWLSALMGFAFVFLLAASLRRLVGNATALFAAALAGLSLYGSFFARMAIETSWTLTFFALNLYVFTFWREARGSRLWPTLMGLSVGLGIFSYPGYTVWLCAVFPFVLWAAWRERLAWAQAAGMGALFALGAAVIAVPTVFFHLSHQPGVPLLRGGGVLLSEQTPYWISLLTHLLDLFISGNSYHLFFKDSGFVESSLWGAFILGAYDLCVRRKSRWAQVLLGSLVGLLFLSALATNFPGMRRAIVFLGPFYLFAGHGLAVLIAAGDTARLGLRFATYAVCVASIAVPAVFLMQTVNAAVTYQPFDKYTGLVQNPEYRTWLERFHVQVIFEQPHDWAEFRQEYIRGYTALMDRYEPGPVEFSSRLTVVPLAQSHMQVQPGLEYLFIVESREFVQELERAGQTCLKNLKQIDTRHQPLFSVEVRLKQGTFCP